MNPKDIKSEDGIEIIDGSGKRLRIREGKLQVKLPGDIWRPGVILAECETRTYATGEEYPVFRTKAKSDRHDPVWVMGYFDVNYTWHACASEAIRLSMKTVRAQIGQLENSEDYESKVLELLKEHSRLQAELLEESGK